MERILNGEEKKEWSKASIFNYVIVNAQLIKGILKATENSKETYTNDKKDYNEGWKTTWEKIDSSLDYSLIL